jgi:acylphosphatase
MLVVRFLVSGQVQGVYFRASTQSRARALGLRGHVRNLPDGRVEVVAGGAPQALAELEAWLHQGPPAARVDTVEREELPPQDHHGFQVH